MRAREGKIANGKTLEIKQLIWVLKAGQELTFFLHLYIFITYPYMFLSLSLIFYFYYEEVHGYTNYNGLMESNLS